MKNIATLGGKSANGGAGSRVLLANAEAKAPLFSALDDIRECISHIDVELASLETRLEPMRQPNPAIPEESGDAPDPSGVMGDLAKIRRALNGYARRISALRASLVV